MSAQEKLSRTTEPPAPSGHPSVSPRATLDEGWVDYVASGQFADVIAHRPSDVVLETIRECRIAWFAGVSHGIAMLVSSGIDPDLLSAVADELLAWVRAESASRGRH